MTGHTAEIAVAMANGALAWLLITAVCAIILDILRNGRGS